MNDIFLRGVIRDISPSHVTKGIDYDKAHMIVKNSNNEQSVVDIVFKHFTNKYKEDDKISLIGNIRTYSEHLQDGKNRIHVYVFTYFDTISPDEIEGTPIETQDNYFQLDGRICKIGELRKFKDGKCNIQLTIANNISKNDKPINSYVPCIAWGRLAKNIATLHVGDRVAIFGELRSHTYTKQLESGDQEIRVAHEAVITDILVNDELDDIEG